MTSALYRTAIAVALFQLFHVTALAGSAETEDPDARPIDDIVVTARRREESLQEVPISVTASRAKTSLWLS